MNTTNNGYRTFVEETLSGRRIVREYLNAAGEVVRRRVIREVSKLIALDSATALYDAILIDALSFRSPNYNLAFARAFFADNRDKLSTSAVKAYFWICEPEPKGFSGSSLRALERAEDRILAQQESWGMYD